MTVPLSIRLAIGALMIGGASVCVAQSTGGTLATGRIPAFPGAEGFGAFAEGGRGGEVYRVTTLDDYGPEEAPISGSLRAAIEAGGPRTVVFRISGIIDLVRPLEIHEPRLTVAGQTAPGDGVTLTTYGVEVYASDVILRYLRVRPGDRADVEQDAITVRGSHVIVDHCSVSWATDETLSVIGQATDVTIQWCFITESLNESVHHKGAHGYGSLLTTTGDVTIHHTLYALHHSRNPRPKDVRLDFRNNVIYGYGAEAGYNYEDFTRMNYVGNYIVPLAFSRDPSCAFNLGGTNSRFFVEDNVLLDGEGVRRDAELLCTPEAIPREGAVASVRVDTALATPSVTTDPAEVAYASILEQGGATRPVRDAVDERIVGLIRSRAGRIIDSQDDVGGWPPLLAADPPRDTDADGMPDAWERQHGLDAMDGEDHAGDLDSDGYTNLEEYINATDPRVPFRWVQPPILHPPAGTAFTDSALTVSVVAQASDVPVYVTLDGREPTIASPRYEQPLTISRSTHVRARAIVDDGPSTSAVARYEQLPWHEAVRVTEATQPGLQYAYYETWDWDDGPPLDSLAPVTIGHMAGLDFSRHARPYGFGLVFDGLLEVPRDGIYGFTFVDDYHSRLFIDGRLVSVGRAPGTQPGRIALRAGKHRFHVRSLHEGRRPDAVLRWEGPGFDLRAIPPEAFFYVPTAH